METAKVEINFEIKVNGNSIVSHTVEQNVIRKTLSFSVERDLATEIIDKLNALYTSDNVFLKEWPDLRNWKQVKEEQSFSKDGMVLSSCSDGAGDTRVFTR